MTSTMAPCAMMKTTNQANEMKWTERIACRLSNRPNHPRALEIAGLCIKPVNIGDWRCDEDRDEAAELLEAIVAVQPSSTGKFSEAYWITVESVAGKTSQVSGTSRATGPCKALRAKRKTVDQPQEIDREVPPARQPKRMAQSGNAEPNWQSDGLSLAVQRRPFGTGTGSETSRFRACSRGSSRASGDRPGFAGRPA